MAVGQSAALATAATTARNPARIGAAARVSTSRSPVCAPRCSKYRVAPAKIKADRTISGAYILYAGFDEAFAACPTDHVVTGGEAFAVGERSFFVETAPGHTVSGIHLLCDDLIFVGDNVLESGGIGWVDVHWGSNPEDHVETLECLRRHCGKLAYPGHGAPYVFRGDTIVRAVAAASFYTSPEHVLGCPRVPSHW